MGGNSKQEMLASSPSQEPTTPSQPLLCTSMAQILDPVSGQSVPSPGPSHFCS